MFEADTGRPFQRNPRGDAFRTRTGWPPRPGITGRRFPSARPRTGAFGDGSPYVVASQQLAASPVHRGHRAAIPRGEALILQALVNHPWLAHDHLEELAGIEFRHADTQRLKAALLDLLAHDGEADAEVLRTALAASGHAELFARVQKGITTQNVWGTGPEAAPDDVLMTWKQLVALHRQTHSLIKELKEAEQALGS